MFWIIVLALFTCISLVWVRWRLWPIFFWPLHLIVSNEDRRSKDRVTFQSFARREFPPAVLVPFSIIGPLFIPTSILCWVFVSLMFISVRLWTSVRALWPTKGERSHSAA